MGVLTRLGPVVLLTSACSGELVHRGDVFLTISGAVDPAAPLTGDDTRGAIAWVWLEDGVLAGYVEPVAFEPRVNGYEIAVFGPPLPHLASAGVAAPEGLTGPRLAWGLPLLYEPTDEGGDVTLEVRPEQMPGWVNGTVVDGRTLVVPEDPATGHLVAVVGEHLLIALEARSDQERLGDDPSWRPGTTCGLDDVVPGLTLYRRPYEDCGEWEMLALPGERTGFQAIGMRAP